MEPTDLELKNDPTLGDYQRYLAEMVKQRGFERETLEQLFMLFLEECGELAKAARKRVDVKSSKDSATFDLEHEAADVFMYLLIICNKLDVDLEQAFRKKEDHNKKRTWT